MPNGIRLQDRVGRGHPFGTPKAQETEGYPREVHDLVPGGVAETTRRGLGQAKGVQEAGG